MERPTLPRYMLSKSERNKFNRACKAWDLAERVNGSVTEEDFDKAYAVLSYVGRLASLEYRNSINDNTVSEYGTLEHRKNLLRAEKARVRAKEMLAPYRADIAYFGCMPTLVEKENPSHDLMVGHW